MEMSFHSQQIKLTFTRNVLHLVATLYFNCFESESFKNSEMVYSSTQSRCWNNLCNATSYRPCRCEPCTDYRRSTKLCLLRVVKQLSLNFHAPLSLWFCGDKKAGWSIVIKLQNIFNSKMVNTCDNSTSMNRINMFVDSVVIEKIYSKL